MKKVRIPIPSLPVPLYLFQREIKNQSHGSLCLKVAKSQLTSLLDELEKSTKVLYYDFLVQGKGLDYGFLKGELDLGKQGARQGLLTLRENSRLLLDTTTSFLSIDEALPFTFKINLYLHEK